MEKKLNLYLNIIESVLIFILVGMGTILYVNQIRFGMLEKNLIITGSFILEFLLISIELFIFYNLKNKYKWTTMVFYLLDFVLLFVIAAKIPFYGIMILLILNITKNILRVLKLEEIKDLNQYYKICETFNIKVKKSTKKRTTTSKVSAPKTKKESTKVPKTTTKKEPEKKATTTKPKTTTSKKTRKSYA